MTSSWFLQVKLGGKLLKLGLYLNYMNIKKANRNQKRRNMKIDSPKNTIVCEGDKG